MNKGVAYKKSAQFSKQKMPWCLNKGKKVFKSFSCQSVTISFSVNNFNKSVDFIHGSQATKKQTLMS